MTYYEITLRFSEEILREYAPDLPVDRPVSEEVLQSVGATLTEMVQDMTSVYSDNSAKVMSVSGPRRERGKDLMDEIGGPLREIDTLNRRITELHKEARTVGEFYDDLLNKVMENAPRCWDGDVAMDSLAVDYVRHLEALTALGATSTHKPTCEGEC